MFPKPGRRGPKFHNRPLRCVSGSMHQSTLEARRCDELHLMQRGGLIRDLKAHPQVRFRITVNDVHICDYVADFVYFDNEQGREVVEDTKGVMTAEARLKLKLMEAVHGITIEVVRRVRLGSR